MRVRGDFGCGSQTREYLCRTAATEMKTRVAFGFLSVHWSCALGFFVWWGLVRGSFLRAFSLSLSFMMTEVETEKLNE